MDRGTSIHRYLAMPAIALVCMLASCGNNILYNEFVALDSNSWHQDSLAVFRTEMTDTAGVCDIAVQVRNDNSYPYANLWLFIDVVAPDGAMRRDTIECVLANADGSWKGGGWGSIYTLRCPYMDAVRFTHAGPYTFRLTQGMRENKLEGIHNIGLLIQQTGAVDDNGKE